MKKPNEHIDTLYEILAFIRNLHYVGNGENKDIVMLTTSAEMLSRINIQDYINAVVYATSMINMTEEILEILEEVNKELYRVSPSLAHAKVRNLIQKIKVLK